MEMLAVMLFLNIPVSKFIGDYALYLDYIFDFCFSIAHLTNFYVGFLAHI
jgi:hypothetical protein